MRKGTDTDFDLIVVGSGAAGMAASIRGAELGARVGIVEAGTVGGTCVNVGCIPSKNLIAGAAVHHVARSGFPGLAGCEPELDWPGFLAQKRELVDSLRAAKYLDVLASYPEIRLLRGYGRLTAEADVAVDGEVQRAGKIVIATGTLPWVPAIPGVETVDVLDSTSVMEVENLPESLIVLGGGSVGLELGQTFGRLGSRVTVLEAMSRLLPEEDAAAAVELREALEAEGLEIATGVRASAIEPAAGGVRVRAEGADGDRTFEAERLLVATGRRANTRGLGLGVPGVETDQRGYIRVDRRMRTSHPSIYAAGDVTGGPGFVYVAAAGGRVAADNALGSASRELDLRAVPRVTFTSPQVAAVGLSPAEAGERGLAVEVGRLELKHVPRALVEQRSAGWIQVVAEKDSGRLLGVQAVGPNAGELLGEATLAVRLGLTIEQITDTLHPYLTWVEGLKLATQALRTDVAKLSCCA